MEYREKNEHISSHVSDPDEKLDELVQKCDELVQKCDEKIHRIESVIARCESENKSRRARLLIGEVSILALEKLMLSVEKYGSEKKVRQKLGMSRADFIASKKLLCKWGSRSL